MQTRYQVECKVPRTPEEKNADVKKVRGSHTENLFWEVTFFSWKKVYLHSLGVLSSVLPRVCNCFPFSNGVNTTKSKRKEHVVFL